MPVTLACFKQAEVFACPPLVQNGSDGQIAQLLLVVEPSSYWRVLQHEQEQSEARRPARPSQNGSEFLLVGGEFVLVSDHAL